MGVTQVSDAKSWEIDVVNSDIPVFVDFWAEWCGPCRMVGPVVEELASDYDGKVKFVKVNVDEANDLASKYNVFSIPTLILLNKGEIVSQQVGAASKESYKNMIDRALHSFCFLNCIKIFLTQIKPY
jgi:thioredoxin 1